MGACFQPPTSQSPPYQDHVNKRATPQNIDLLCLLLGMGSMWVCHLSLPCSFKHGCDWPITKLGTLKSFSRRSDVPCILGFLNNFLAPAFDSMGTKAFRGSLVLRIKVTSHNSWILTAPLTMFGVAGELMAFPALDINYIDLGLKEGIDFRPPILLQAH